MNFTICVINDKRVVRRAKDYNFDSRLEAERFAEGMVIGMRVCNKRWSVVLVQDDILDEATLITKDLTSKRAEILFREYGYWKH